MKPLIAACFGVVLASAAFAADWQPAKNIEIVVPSAPGGSNDKTARTIEKAIHDRRLLPQATLSVNNKPGGGGNIALAYLNQHAGDGHYIFIATPSILTNQILGSSALTYSEFTPVALLFSEYVVFAVKADSPIRSGKDLAERLRKDTQSVSVAFATALGNHKWKEQGVDLVFGGWRAVFAPKGLSAAQSAYWENLLGTIVKSPDWREDLERFYWTDTFVTGEAFKKRLGAENAELKSMLSTLGIAK